MHAFNDDNTVPLTFPSSFDDEGKPTRKEFKREQKRERDQVRLIDGWEQYRTLWDGIEFKRQIINMGDKRVRFALAIMAALNAALLLVLTRAPVIQLIATSFAPWIGVLLVIYGFFSFGFMASTIEALRPAQAEAKKEDVNEWRSREFGEGSSEGRPVGLLIRGPLDRMSFDEERHTWNNARLSDINAELILFNRSSSFVMTRQMSEIRKVYQRLKMLVLLAAATMTLVAIAMMAERGGWVMTTINGLLH